MSDENVLTKEIAEQFLADEDSVDLSEFTMIEDMAAEGFSRHEGYLGLSGLTSLSDAAVESLSKHEGELDLCGLTSLSDAAAESLSKHEGTLVLDGLTSLSDAAAESLSKHRTLSTRDIYVLTSEAAFKLTVGDGGEVWLESVDDIPQFVRFKDLLTNNHVLKLGGQDDELTSEHIDSLSALECTIDLSPLEEINEKLAEKLASFNASSLDLRECELLSNEAAELLLKFNGSLKIKLCSQDECTRKTLKTHHSLANWGEVNGPYVDQVCKNCGFEDRLEFPDSEDNIYTLFGDGPWDLCSDCRDELTEEQIASLEED